MRWEELRTFGHFNLLFFFFSEILGERTDFSSNWLERITADPFFELGSQEESLLPKCKILYMATESYVCYLSISIDISSFL